MAEDGKMKGKVSVNRFWAGRSLRMKEEEEVEIGDVKMEGAAFLSLSLSLSRTHVGGLKELIQGLLSYILIVERREG